MVLCLVIVWTYVKCNGSDWSALHPRTTLVSLNQRRATERATRPRGRGMLAHRGVVKNVFVQGYTWLYVEINTDHVEGVFTNETIWGADTAVSQHIVMLCYSLLSTLMRFQIRDYGVRAKKNEHDVLGQTGQSYWPAWVFFAWFSIFLNSRPFKVTCGSHPSMTKLTLSHIHIVWEINKLDDKYSPIIWNYISSLYHLKCYVISET